MNFYFSRKMEVSWSPVEQVSPARKEVVVVREEYSGLACAAFWLGLFGLIAFICYIRYREREDRRAHGLPEQG